MIEIINKAINDEYYLNLIDRYTNNVILERLRQILYLARQRDEMDREISRCKAVIGNHNRTDFYDQQKNLYFNPKTNGSDYSNYFYFILIMFLSNRMI